MKSQQGITGTLVVLILLFVGVVGFSGYVVYSSQVKESEPTIVPEQTTKKSSEVDDSQEIVDQQTETSTEIKWNEEKLVDFTISYPEGWNFNDCEGVVLIGSTDETTGRCQSGFGGQIMINKTSTNGVGSITDTYYDDIVQTDLTLNEVPCIRYSATFSPTEEFIEPIPTGSKLIRYVCTKDAENVYVANYMEQPTFPDVASLFEEMVTQKWQF